MKLYHVTNKNFTKKLITKSGFIDVKIGRGELGKGFYTSEHAGLIAMWAKNKYHNNSSVIVFDIDEFDYFDLDIKIIKKIKDVKHIYNTNQNKIFNCDAVEVPFISLDSRIQI